MWLPASAASTYSTVTPEFVDGCVEDLGMEVVAAPAEGAKEGRRGGGEGVIDGVRKRDVGWTRMGDNKPVGDPKLCKTSFSCATCN